MKTSDSDFKIAVLATIFRHYSHADVILSRWQNPKERDHEWNWKGGTMKIASLFVDQKFENDMSVDYCQKHDIPMFSSIREALTLGTDKLAVDAVLIIAEHGSYRTTKWQQIEYPRAEFFHAAVDVMEESGRIIPVFNDKHIAWSPARVASVCERVRRLNIPYFATSTLPLSPKNPPLAPEFLDDPKLYVSVCNSSLDPHGYHSFEWAQSLIEQRKGGEAGPEKLTVYSGEKLWNFFDAHPDLKQHLSLAFDLLEPKEDEPKYTLEEFRKVHTCVPPQAMDILHRDGFRSIYVAFPGAANGWAFSVENKKGESHQRKCLLGGLAAYAAHFANLNNELEKFYRTQVPPTPLARAEFVAGLLAEAHVLLDHDRTERVFSPTEYPPYSV